MVTAGVLLPRDSEALRPPVSSPYRQLYPNVAPWLQVRYHGRMLLQLGGTGLEQITIQVYGLRKHTRVSLVRGFPPLQAGDLSLFPGARQLFAPECSEARSEGARHRLGQGQTFLNPDQLL